MHFDDNIWFTFDEGKKGNGSWFLVLGSWFLVLDS